jgi:CDP-glycerol glycerophosphotransferase
MATFTFSAGNTRVLLRLPVYLLGALATRLVRRTPRLWVFGSGIGLGEGALPLLQLARRRLDAHTRLVWLASSHDELAAARALGLDAVAKGSVRGLWLTLRAQVLVVTHGMGDVNRYGVHGGFLVQLWHGVPLKRLHLDSPAALRSSSLTDSRLVRAVLAHGYRMAGRQIALFPVASERIVDRIASAFAVDRRHIAVTGDPRDDILLQGDPAARRAAARRVVQDAVGPVPPSAQLVLYAPTWREGDPDPSVPDEQTWRDIAAWLERTDAVLLVRSHPLGRGAYAAGAQQSSRIRLLDPSDVTDVNTVLSAMDALITDYSSIAFDYALVGGPTVFLAADVESYTSTRGLYETYASFTGGEHVVTWAHALAVLDDLWTVPAALAAAHRHSQWLRDEHFDYLDGGAGERVLALILARTGAAPPTLTGSADRIHVTGLGFTSEHLVVDVAGLGASATGARLEGARARVDADLDATTDGVRLRLPLLVSRWGTPGLALPSGAYRLVIDGPLPTTRIEVSGDPPPRLRHPLFHADAHAEAGGLVLRISPPLADDERRPVPHRDQRQVYLRGPVRPENAVYFESFYGRTASDNPAAIDRALARLHPEVRRYWSVADGSIAVPEGAIRIVEGSAEWWRVRAEARVYVINDWLRWTFYRRRHQHVLQTWHGTMLKRLAIDRPDVTARIRFAVVRQQRRWDALLAQNEYSAQIFRSAYAVHGPIWETGYPRNDVLSDTDHAEAVRARVGVPPGARVVLYAPTWRDDRTEMVDHLDLVALATDLPPDDVLLVRGHSRTLAHGQDMQADRLIDVTSYPDASELMLIADVLVTDYSSMMFDFVGTGKPLIFFTPDIAHYGEVLRGFYFDLLAEAPGPVVTTYDDLLVALCAGPDATDRFRERQAAWRAKFTPHDDGHAAERVVQRLYDEGWLG